MRHAGFTMLELTIATSILSVVALMAFVAVQASTNSVLVAEASGLTQANVRDALQQLAGELQLSAKVANAALNPPLDRVRIETNPAPASPIQLVFQVPLDDSGRRWSQPIRYRYVNEDVNGNGRRDSLAAEPDVDGDGLLTRRLLRLQDLNGDGDTNDPGEVRTVAGANDISNVQFAITDDVVTVTLTSTRLVGARRTNPITATVTSRVYLLN